MPKEEVARFEGGKQYLGGFNTAPPAGKKPPGGAVARGEAKRRRAKARKNASF